MLNRMHVQKASSAFHKTRSLVTEVDVQQARADAVQNKLVTSSMCFGLRSTRSVHSFTRGSSKRDGICALQQYRLDRHVPMGAPSTPYDSRISKACTS
jgi:hypothetical protein